MSKKIKKWELLEEKDVSPSPWYPIFKHKVKLPNGKVIDDYYLAKIGDSAMILAITKQKEIIFVRQYKHGAGEVIVELPAGRIRADFTPEKEARTELKEETGFVANELEHLGTLVLEPSKNTLRSDCFLTRNVEVQKKQKLDETEDIEIILVPTKGVDQWIKTGKIIAADTIAFIKIAQLKIPDLFK